MKAYEGSRAQKLFVKPSYLFCYQDKSSPTSYLAQLTTHFDLIEILKPVLAFLEPYSNNSPTPPLHTTLIYSEFLGNNKQGPSLAPLWLH